MCHYHNCLPPFVNNSYNKSTLNCLGPWLCCKQPSSYFSASQVSLMYPLFLTSLPLSHTHKRRLNSFISKVFTCTLLSTMKAFYSPSYADKAPIFLKIVMVGKWSKVKAVVEYIIVMVGKVLFFMVYTSKGVITFTSCLVLSFLRVMVIVVVSPLN